jgi:serine/threonine-protein kinase
MTRPQQYQRLGKFELHQLIGEGAMGVVWKAYDSMLRRYVALKLLNTTFGATQELRERFLREARAAGVLQHANIVTVYDLGEAQSQLFIAMELVEGRDLSEMITTREPLALERKLDIVIEVLEGLHYAHQRGVIHRDVKPSNVRIMPDGRVKIMDFGIARLQSAEISGGGSIMGTPTYMAPEQITEGTITAATDVFAVGCMLYELLSYQKPFEGDSIHRVLYQVLTTDPKALRMVAPSIPAALERVVTKAMSKVPSERYRSAKEMRQTLVGIRLALSGATDGTTQVIGLRWSRPFLKLVTRAPAKWRLAVLTALAVVAAALALLPPSEPIAAPDEPAPPPVASPVAGEPAAEPSPPPSRVDFPPAVTRRRTTALAAREGAERAGAPQNALAPWVHAEALFERATRDLDAGRIRLASQGLQQAAEQYRAAQAEAARLEREARAAIERVAPIATALSTRREGTKAIDRLERAQTLLEAKDFGMIDVIAEQLERMGRDAGIAIPSAQPAAARAAVEVLMADLARAVATERIENLNALFATAMSPEDDTAWRQFFAMAHKPTVTYRIIEFEQRGDVASAVVRAVYRFVEREGGPPLEDRQELIARFTRVADAWRIASLKKEKH